MPTGVISFIHQRRLLYWKKCLLQVMLYALYHCAVVAVGATAANAI